MLLVSLLSAIQISSDYTMKSHHKIGSPIQGQESKLLISQSDIQSLGGTSASPKSFKICNNSTKGKVYAAIAYNKDSAFYTEGWWGIDQNQCVALMKRNRPSKLYFYVEDVGSRYVWRSKESNAPAWCVDNKAFTLKWDPNSKQWNGPCPRRVTFRTYINNDIGPATYTIID